MGCESYHTQYRVVIQICQGLESVLELYWADWYPPFRPEPQGFRTEKQNHLELFGAGRIPSLSYRVSNAHSLYEVSSTVATFGMLGASPLEFPRRDPCERLQ